MLKKVILVALLAGLIAVLVIGAINRTAAKLAQSGEVQETGRGRGFGQRGDPGESVEHSSDDASLWRGQGRDADPQTEVNSWKDDEDDDAE